ncbi:MAG: hypothetical protein ACTS73_08175 [Arsenophonus sp. NEOnobi-MAG3]
MVLSLILSTTVIPYILRNVRLQGIGLCDGFNNKSAHKNNND